MKMQCACVGCVSGLVEQLRDELGQYRDNFERLSRASEIALNLKDKRIDMLQERIADLNRDKRLSGAVPTALDMALESTQKELAESKAEIERLNSVIAQGELASVRYEKALDLVESLRAENTELKAKISNLQTPESIWNAFHALGDKVLGPWVDGPNLEVRRYGCKGFVFSRVKLLSDGKFGAKLSIPIPEKNLSQIVMVFDDQQSAQAWCDRIAIEYSFTLIGGINDKE